MSLVKLRMALSMDYSVLNRNCETEQTTTVTKQVKYTINIKIKHKIQKYPMYK